MTRSTTETRWCPGLAGTSPFILVGDDPTASPRAQLRRGQQRWRRAAAPQSQATGDALIASQEAELDARREPLAATAEGGVDKQCKAGSESSGASRPHPPPSRHKPATGACHASGAAPPAASAACMPWPPGGIDDEWQGAPPSRAAPPSVAARRILRRWGFSKSIGSAVVVGCAVFRRW